MEERDNCSKCGKPIEWKLSLWKRMWWLFKGKNHQKVCEECYENLKNE